MSFIQIIWGTGYEYLIFLLDFFYTDLEGQFLLSIYYLIVWPTSQAWEMWIWAALSEKKFQQKTVILNLFLFCLLTCSHCSFHSLQVHGERWNHACCYLVPIFLGQPLKGLVSCWAIKNVVNNYWREPGGRVFRVWLSLGLNSVMFTFI